MDRFQIVETSGDLQHAGTKATADIACIAAELGFNRLCVRMNTTRDGVAAKFQRQWGYLKDWNGCYGQISDGAVVLLQHPFHYPQLTRERILRKLKYKKHVRFICLVHDVEKLRAFRYNSYYRHEADVMLELADTLIVHNQVMLDYFKMLGVSEERLVSLEIFDYLRDEAGAVAPGFAREINVAGNLDAGKCGYLAKLGSLDGVIVNLFGPDFDMRMSRSKNIIYHGSFPPSEIPDRLTAGFGLVWDGDSVDGCKGAAGQYLCYNNPHKLSLYLASGIPVIIWAGAAEASFVTEHKVGICVNSLCELTDILGRMTKEQYGEYAEAVRAVRGRLTEGYYTRRAIGRALDIVER